MWRPVFESLDVDHDGRIPFDDFSAMLKEGNSQLNEIPDEVLQRILQKVDWDRNQSLTYDEFLHMVCSFFLIAVADCLH